MAEAKVSLEYRGRKAGFVVQNLDFDAKRDALALKIGRLIVDAAWALEEKK